MRKKGIIISVIILLIMSIMGVKSFLVKDYTVINQFKGTSSNFNASTAKGTITLDKDGGTGGTTTLYYKNADALYTDENCTSAVTNITVPTKAGYDFEGYYYKYEQAGSETSEYQIIKADGSYVGSSSFASYLFNTIGGDITITAKWKKVFQTITLDKDGGTGGPNYLYVLDGVAYIDNAFITRASNITVPTKSGYKFTGYQSPYGPVVDEDGTISDNAISAIWTGTKSDYTITAKWEKVFQTITLDKDGGTGGPNYLYVLDGVAYIDNAFIIRATNITVPTKSGYKFTGYQSPYGPVVDEDGTISDNAISAIWTGTKSDYTITAQWEKTSGEDTNIEASSIEIKQGNKITLNAYDSTGAILEVVFNPTNTTDKTITWTNSDSTVVLDTPDPADNTKTYMRQVIGLKAGKSTITARTSNGKTATCEITVIDPTVVTGITASIDNQKIKVGEYAQITATLIPDTATIKTIVYESSNNDVAWVDGNGKITGMGKGTATIKASSQQNPEVYKEFNIEVEDSIHTVTLDANGGTGGTSKIYFKRRSSSVYSDSSCTEAITKIEIPTKAGYKFKGYKSGTTQAIEEDGTITSEYINSIINGPLAMGSGTTSNITAEWVKAYTATINPGGKTISGEEGEEINIASYIKRPTLTFDYNYNSKTSSITPGVQMACTTGKIETKSESEVIYTFGESDTTITITLNDITLETPEAREGYEFVGWYNEKENGTRIGGAGDKYNITEDQTIYAHWKSTSDENVPVTGVELDKNTVDITVGGTTTIKAIVKPENSTNKNVKYISSDEEIATVSQAGIVTGKKAGTVTITVTTEDGNKTATCTVTVKEISVEDPDEKDETMPTIDKVEVAKDKYGNNILYIIATDGGSGVYKVTVNGTDITNQITEDGKYYYQLNKDGEYEIVIEDNKGNIISKTLKWEDESLNDNPGDNDNSENNNEGNGSNGGNENVNNNSGLNGSGNNTLNNQISGSSTTAKDSTTAYGILPKTGRIAGIISIIGIITVGIISAVQYKKLNIK